MKSSRVVREREAGTVAGYKRLLARKLLELRLPDCPMTARWVARGFCPGRVHITIHGWRPNPAASRLKEVWWQNGFVVEFDVMI